jgi:hypothetical protein
MSRGCFLFAVTLAFGAFGCAGATPPTDTPTNAVDLGGGNGSGVDLAAPADPRDLAATVAVDLAGAVVADLAGAGAPAGSVDLAGGGAHDLAAGAGGDLAVARDLAVAVGDLAIARDLAVPVGGDLAIARDLAVPVGGDLAIARDLAVPVSGDLAVAHDLAAPTGGDLAVAHDLAAPTGGDLAAPIGGLDLAATADLARCPFAPAGGDGGATATLYVLAPTSGGLFAARARGGAWSALPAPATTVAVDDVALAAIADRPLGVIRQHDSTLATVRFDDCSGFGAPAVLGAASSSLRPALVGGATADVIFRGSVDGDARLYWLHDDGSGFGAIAVEGNFLSTLPPTAFRSGSDVHTIFTGTDGNLYDGVVQPAAGGAAIALTGNTSARAPAVAVDGSGNVHVLYSGNDNHLYWFVAAQPTVVHSLCDGQPASCYVVTDSAPLLTIGSDGAPVAIYRGSDRALYGARLVGGQWTAAVAVSAGETTSWAAALVGGSGGSLADVVYVRDGDQLPRHAVLGSAGWSAPITVATTPLNGAPALAVGR